MSCRPGLPAPNARRRQLKRTASAPGDIRDQSPRQSAGCRTNESRAAPLDAVKPSASASKWPGMIMSSFDSYALPEAQVAAPGRPLGRQRRVEQAQPVSRGRGLATAAHAELAQNVRDMDAGGLGGDEELGGDLRV